MSTETVKARLAAATPGPWTTMDTLSGRQVYSDRPGVKRWVALTQRKPDADLIAHAPTDLAALLAVVEAARCHRPEMVDVLAHGCVDGDCTHDECPTTPTQVCQECLILWTQDGRREDFDDSFLWPCPIGAALDRFEALP